MVDTGKKIEQLIRLQEAQILINRGIIIACSIQNLE